MSAKKERINIRSEVAAVCERLGLEPSRVGRLDIRPGDVNAVVYLTDVDGKLYIDETNGEAAVERYVFEVLT